MVNFIQQFVEDYLFQSSCEVLQLYKTWQNFTNEDANFCPVFAHQTLNKLPTHVRNLTGCTAFKKALKTNLFFWSHVIWVLGQLIFLFTSQEPNIEKTRKLSFRCRGRKFPELNQGKPTQSGRDRKLNSLFEPAVTSLNVV